jgi:hypothetical protein
LRGVVGSAGHLHPDPRHMRRLVDLVLPSVAALRLGWPIETRTETGPEMITPMWIRKGQVRAEAPGFEPGRGGKPQPH